VKAYKGFNKDMTCRGFQYKEGETYHEDKAELCESGFHACEDPIDCLAYYEPSTSTYHEVEIDEVDKQRGNDSKVCGKEIKIGAEIDLFGICKAHFEYIKTKEELRESTGDRSANSATEYGSANSATGYGSANVTTGNKSSNDACTGSISVGWGKDNVCKGEIGSYIVLVERGEWDGEKYPQIGEPKFGKVDGITLKADTWYKLVNGEFVEVSDDDK
jgi:hypothetical protein